MALSHIDDVGPGTRVRCFLEDDLLGEGGFRVVRSWVPCTVVDYVSRTWDDGIVLIVVIDMATFYSAADRPAFEGAPIPVCIPALLRHCCC